MLTPLDVYTQQHVYRAHVNIYQNVEKSKLKLRHTRAISTAINAIIDNGGDLMYHWVHQRDEDGNDIFSLQYMSEVSTTPTGVFYADGDLWYQYQLEFWLSDAGILLTVFSCGDGRNSSGVTRHYQPTAEPWTQDQQSAEYQTAVRCMSKYLFHYWLVYRIIQC